MVTTIQLSDETKKELAELKKKGSYEDVIKDMIRKTKRQIIAEQMREYALKYREENLKEVKDWEHTETDWEWNEEK